MPTTLIKNENFPGAFDTNRAAKFFEEKISFTISPYELLQKVKEQDINIVDVRDRESYKELHIKRAISVPISELTESLDKFSKDKINVLYCYNDQCKDSAIVALTLARLGYPVMELDGGFKNWSRFAYPVEKGIYFH